MVSHALKKIVEIQRVDYEMVTRCHDHPSLSRGMFEITFVKA